MIAEIGMGLQAIKSGTDLLKVLNATATQTQINEIKIGLQQSMLEAQSALFAAQQEQAANAVRMAELEQELVRFKDWEAEKRCYELKPITPGKFVYAVKAGMERGQPPHWLCVACFDKGQRSVLQNVMRVGADGHATGRQDYARHQCPSCANWIALPYTRSPESPDAPV